MQMHGLLFSKVKDNTSVGRSGSFNRFSHWGSRVDQSTEVGDVNKNELRPRNKQGENQRTDCAQYTNI
jgi:hypothetical protein